MFMGHENKITQRDIRVSYRGGRVPWEPPPNAVKCMTVGVVISVLLVKFYPNMSKLIIWNVHY